MKLICILGTTKWRLPQWPGPHHKSNPKSASSYGKHLSRKPNIHQSQSSNSAYLVYLNLENRICQPYKKSLDLLANHVLSNHVCDASFNSKNSALPKNPREGCSTACKPLYSHNAWIVFPWIKHIKLVIKLCDFCHLIQIIHLQKLTYQSTIRLRTEFWEEWIQNITRLFRIQIREYVFFSKSSQGQRIFLIIECKRLRKLCAFRQNSVYLTKSFHKLFTDFKLPKYINTVGDSCTIRVFPMCKYGSTALIRVKNNKENTQLKTKAHLKISFTVLQLHH